MHLLQPDWNRAPPLLTSDVTQDWTVMSSRGERGEGWREERGGERRGGKRGERVERGEGWREERDGERREGGERRGGCREESREGKLGRSN